MFSIFRLRFSLCVITLQFSWSERSLIFFLVSLSFRFQRWRWRLDERCEERRKKQATAKKKNTLSLFVAVGRISREMASRFDDSSSGSSSEDEEEAPQLDGMTSSDDDEAFEGAFGGGSDADVLEVRKKRGESRAKSERRRWTPLASKFLWKIPRKTDHEKTNSAHHFFHSFFLAFSSPTTPMMTTRHQRCCETAWTRR